MEKRYITLYVEKYLADKLESIKDGELLNQELLKYVEEHRKEFSIYISEIDESIALYRAAMIKARESFQAAKNEQLSTLFAIWEKYEEELGTISIKTKKVIEELNPFIDTIKIVEGLLKNISFYNIEKLISLIEKFNQMSTEDKNLIKFILTEYKN